MNYRFSSWPTVYRGLMSAFDDRRYHLGSEVVDFDQGDRGVTIRLGDGTTRTLDMVVCADGISSTCRTKLLPGAKTRYAGYVAWRAMIPESDLDSENFEALRDSLTFSILPDGHVLAYPIPEPRGAPRTGAPAREPRLLSQLRRGRRG